MKSLKSPLIFWSFSVGFMLLSCGDLVKEDPETSQCSQALNDRNYNAALEKCTQRKDIAAAYLGKAGYDIVGLTEAGDEEAITTPAVTAVLGEEDVAFAFAVNTLRLGSDKIPDLAAREQAMKASRANLEKVVELYDGVSVTGDELILKMLGTVFATSLELVLLLDVGMGTTLDVANFAPGFVANNGEFLITSTPPPTIPADRVAVSQIAGKPANDYIKKLDGRIWKKEEDLAFLPESIAVGAANQAMFGNPLLLYGNLDAVCRSFTDAKTPGDSPGQGIVSLIAKTSAVVTEFQNNFSGSTSDLVSDVQSIEQAINALNIGAACALRNVIALP